ncbi:MAG: hypothetical protein WC071_13325, partial [Victivallaceae bacterium]
MDKILPEVDFERLDILITLALEEDLGKVGDTTSNAVIPKKTKAVAELRCKEDCVCAGLDVAKRVFKTLDPVAIWKPLVKDGDFCKTGTVLAEVSGKARALLTAER